MSNWRRTVPVMIAAALIASGLYGFSAKDAKYSVAWEVPGLSHPESAVYDAARDVIYVANMGPKSAAKDGDGFISQVSPAGALMNAKWIVGLSNPKGLAIKGGSLLVADTDRLLEIDIASAKTVKEYPAEGAQALNDVAVDKDGNVYVSDNLANAVYKLPAMASNGQPPVLAQWIQSSSMRGPNGLLIEGDQLVMACYGIAGGDAAVLGHVKKAALADGKTVKLGKGTPIGHLDGVAGDGQGNYFVTEWKKAQLLLVAPDGTFTLLLQLDKGCADFDYVPAKGMFYIPINNADKLTAVKVE